MDGRSKEESDYPNQLFIKRFRRVVVNACRQAKNMTILFTSAGPLIYIPLSHLSILSATHVFAMFYAFVNPYVGRQLSAAVIWTPPAGAGAGDAPKSCHGDPCRFKSFLFNSGEGSCLQVL